MSDLFDFAVITIFAREFMEASIIIGEYRTIIMKTETWPEGMDQERALRAVRWATILASLFALLVIMAVAIPLGILSHDFDSRTSTVIEGASKIVAAICILQLSLKLPKWLGIYASKKTNEGSAMDGLTLGSIRFNVAWNIWREVAECGVFLIPFFLSGEGVKAIPLSAVVGSLVGLLIGLGIYYANKRLKNKMWLAMFMATLLLVLSTGLFTGGAHNLEAVLGKTPQVWSLPGEFWSTDRLPMTIFKPFGYSSSRTVLQIACFWGWLAFGCLLHFRKYRMSRRILEISKLSRFESTGMESSSSHESQPSDVSSTDSDIEAPADEICAVSEASSLSFEVEQYPESVVSK